jgi:hypothetical protein
MREAPRTDSVSRGRFFPEDYLEDISTQFFISSLTTLSIQYRYTVFNIVIQISLNLYLQSVTKGFWTVNI